MMDFLCTGLSDIDQEDIWTLCQVVSSPSTHSSATSERALRMLLGHINKESAEERLDDSATTQDRLDLESVATTSAIYKVVSTVDEIQVTADLFPQILCALIKLISSAVGKTGSEAFNACGLAVETLEMLLARHNNCDDGIKWIEVELLKCEQTHTDGMSHLARHIVTSGASWIGEVVSGLLPLLETSHQAHLTTGIAFFMELLYFPGITSKKILKNIIKAMVKIYKSSSAAVRCLCLRALSNAANGAHKLVRKYKDSILGTLLASMYDDQEDPSVIEESLKASARIVKLLSKKEMGQQFVEMAVFCHMFLMNEKESVQMEAILLLGELARKCTKSSKGSVTKHFQICLAPLLLKLQHKDIQIVSAALFSLHNCLPIMDCKDMQTLLQGQNMAQGGNKWLRNIYKTLVLQHPELATYLVVRSVKLLCRIDVLCEAITQIGYLLEFMDYRQLNDLNDEVNLSVLWEDMKGLARYPIPGVEEAACHLASLLSTRLPEIVPLTSVLSMRAAVMPTEDRTPKFLRGILLESIIEEDEEQEEEWFDCLEEM